MTGRPKGTKKNGLKYLNTSELEAFTTALKSSGRLRDRLMMSLTLYLGLRVGELVALKVKDLGFDSGEITVHALKGGRTRTYLLEERLWKLLKRYLKKETITEPDERLFPVTDQTAKNVFKRVAKAAGLSKDFSIHSLRHTCGMLRAKSNDSPIKIMLWLRHRSVISTEIYFEQTAFENDDLRMNALMGKYL